MTIRETGQLLRKRKISCRELIDQTLADIQHRDVFRSLITLMEEDARREADDHDRELAAGVDRGPFHGIPTAHKDLFYTRGVRTTGGSLVFRDFIPDHDATVVERLKTAGAVCVGKTNLHELAYGITSKNPHYGFVLNPLDTNRIPGGSSGGSAAMVAAGFLPMSLGTDTGGSIRIPASFCGIVGLKPTYGRVSRHGVLPLSFSLDHVGPLGSCVDDCALAFEAIAESDGEHRPALALKDLRIGVPANFYFDRIDAEVSAAANHAIAAMQHEGALVTEVRVPDPNEMNAVARVVQLSETASLYAQYTDSSMFGSDVWALIQQGKMIPAHEYVSAQRIRTLLRREFDTLWKNVDILVTPTTPITAPLIDQNEVLIGSETENTRMAATRLVRAINLIGEPALSMPCGKTATGLPVGLQLIAAPFDESKLLQVAKALEPLLN
jgi:aspartyl-tRNA(Asn)/glutamyl-tRNA(Gln) amidotransferase subunit A